MAETFRVEIVSADCMVWEGDALQITATTTEGEIGILARHIPLIATLAAGMAEVTTPDGNRIVAAVDGGFIAVTTDHTAIISPYARLAAGINADEARRELEELKVKLEAGDNSVSTKLAYNRALVQVKAADRLT